MTTLPSGLPEHVEDSERLTRFLASRSHFNSEMAKPAAFLPNPKHRNSSVFRMAGDETEVKAVWDATTDGERTLKGVAVVLAKEVRLQSLDVIAEEPPDAHANLEGWPWSGEDPDLAKAKQKEIASEIARRSTLIVY